jgi:hypothetical protein
MYLKMSKIEESGSLGLIKRILDLAETGTSESDINHTVGSAKYDECLIFLVEKKLLTRSKGAPESYKTSGKGRSFITELDEICRTLF